MHTQRTSAARLLSLLLTGFVLLAVWQAASCDADPWDDGQSEPQARQAALVSWRQVERWLATSPDRDAWLKRLRGNELLGQLQASAPDWLLTHELERGFAAESARLDSRIFATFHFAWHRWMEKLPVPSLPALAELARRSRSSDVSVDRGLLEARRARFAADLQRVATRFGRPDADKSWLKYLQISELQAMVGDTRRLIAGWPSVVDAPRRWQMAALILTLDEVRSAAESLAELAAPLRVAAEPRFAEQRTNQLTRLAELLAGVSDSTDAKSEMAVICRWLEDRNWDRNLVQAVEAHFGHPNLLVYLPATFCQASLARPLAESFPVDEVIAGTRVRGSGRLAGQLSCRLWPQVGAGSLELAIRAETRASTVGFSQNVRVASSSVTELTGAKRVAFDAVGFRLMASSVSANTRISYDSIDAPQGLFGGIGQEARRRVYERRAVAERETEASTSRQVRNILDATVRDATGKWERRWRNDVILPLAYRQVWPETHAIVTSPEGIRLSFLQRTAGHFGAPGPPPRLASVEQARMLMHASFPEQLATALIQGRTVEGLRFRELFQPGESTTESSDDDWSLTFAAAQPVRVAFRDQVVRIEVRLDGFRSGDRNYEGMEVTSDYQLQSEDGQLVLERVGEFEVFPIGFVRGEQRLSGPQQVRRQILRRKLNENVARRFVAELPGSVRIDDASDDWMEIVES